MPDNEFSIKITGDASELKQATDAAKEQFDKASKSVDMLAELIGVKVPDALKKLIASSELAGPALEAVFPIAAGLAAINVLQQLGQKLGELVSDTFIFTDAQKAEDAALKASNKALYDATLRVKELGRETQITAEKTEAGKDKLRLQFKQEDLGGSSAKLKAEIEKTDGLIAGLQKKVSQGIDTSTIAKPQNDLTASITNTSHAIDEQRDALSGVSAQIKKLQSDRERLNIAFIDAQAVEKKGAQDISNDLAIEDAARLQKSIQTNIARIDAGKKTNDAIIQQEQQAIRQLEAAHQISAEDALALNKSLIDKKFHQDEAALNAKLEQLKRDPDRNAAQIIGVQGEIKTLTVQHYTELEKLNADYNKQVEHNGQEAVNKAAARMHELVQQVKQSQQIILESAKAHDQAMGQIADQRLNFELQLGKISQGNYEKQLQWEMAETYANERQKLEAKRAAAQGNLVEQARVDAELQKLDDKYLADSEKAEQKSYLRRRQQFDQYFTQVSSSFNTALNGWMQGTESASQAFGKMFQDIMSQLINFVEQWIEKKVEMWLMDKLITQTTQSAAATAQITSNAAVAYSGAYAATAVIPFIGPELAPEAAMMAYMDVMAMTPAGFALGGIVPATGLALVHQGEKILPKSMSGDGSGLGGITVVVNHSVNAVDAESFQGHIRRHGNMIANEVTRALKRKGVR